MALTENGNSNGMIMPVAPMYGGYGGNGGFGFGGDWAWILLLLVLGGGWGGFGSFGMGGAMMGAGMMDGMMLYPWMNQAEITTQGFQNAQLSDSVTSVRDGISALSTQLCNCCGDMRYDMANGFNGVNQNLCNGFNSVNNSVFGAQTAISQQMNANEIASLNRSFAEQTANTAGFNGVQNGISDLRYTVATENCADRAALSDGIRDILAATQAQTQTILDKMCQDKIDAKNDEISQLRQEILYARGQASQIAQNQQIVDGIYNRLDTCPVGTTPVYGRTPIFTCNSGCNTGCGCGCGNFG